MSSKVHFYSDLPALPSAPPENESGQCRIGVIIYGQGEMGRAILRGAHAFCRQESKADLVYLSEKGFQGDILPKINRADVLLVQDANPAHLKVLQQHCPVTISLSNRNPSGRVAKVLNDDMAIGELGANYLFRRGFRTFAFLTAGWHENDKVIPFLFARERWEGFLRQLRPTGLPIHQFLFASIPQMPALVKTLLGIPGRIGIMTSSDHYARWLLEALPDPQELVPHKFAILGVDDDPLMNAIAPIPISSIHPAGERLGFEAARLSVDLFYGRQTGHPEIRIIPSHLHTRASTDVFAVDDPGVAKAQRWIRTHLGDAVDVNDVVQAMGISRRNLEEKFRQNLGRGIASEILQARITRATELLGSTELSINEIAYLVGFSESRLLSRNFRKLTGETPREYRSRINPA